MRGPTRTGRPQTKIVLYKWMKNGQKQSVKSSKNTKTNNANIKNVKLTKSACVFFFLGKMREKGGGIMAYRKTVKPKIDKKIFTNTAKKTKKINVNPKPSRGGIRL